jgi:cardiolipin synthase
VQQRDQPCHPVSARLPRVQTQFHELSLLPSLNATIEALESDIDRAVRRVWIEIFIFRADEFGQRMAKRLIAARKRGVDVRVLYDSLGSRTTPESFFASMRQEGVDVRCYRPWHKALRALRLWPRDHARILCIDDCVYTGGIGFGSEWLPRALGGLGWHDVCCRVHGPVVKSCARSFLAQWEKSASNEDSVTAHEAFPELAFVADSPFDSEGVFPMYRQVVQAAQRRIWIENAYFLPPRPFLRDLYRAAARGVDVQILVPGASDVPTLARAARAEYSRWLRRGLRIFEYIPGVTHAKFAVVDDDWCTVGSFNLNPTSLICSRESNMFIYHPAFVAQAAEQFLRDRAECREIELADLDKVSVSTRVGNHLLRTGVRMLERFSLESRPTWS